MLIIANREREARAQWESKPYYPEGDGFTWESFLEAQKGKTGPFALTFVRGPAHQEIMWSAYPYVFVGLFADRDDGRLGKLCIGQGTRHMECDGNGLLYADGLDAGLLQTLNFKEGVLQKLPRNKVVSIKPLGDELERSFLWKFVRPDANDGLPLNKADAAAALRLRDYLHELFGCWRSKDLVKCYFQLEDRLKERRDIVAAETARVRRQLSEILRQNEEEMALLLNKPL